MRARFHPFTDLMLERYLVGELSVDEAAQVEQAAASRPELQAYLAERRAEREAFRWTRPPLQLPAREARAPLWQWALGLGAVLATMLLIVVSARSDEGPLGRRGSGAVAVSVAVLRGTVVLPWRPGVVLEPRDRLRLTLTSAEAGFATIIGEDVRKQPQVLYDGVAVNVGTSTLPDSLEVDGTPGSERLVVFFSQGRRPAAEFLERVRRGALDGASVLTLEKVRP
jgi:hypothetical protein